MRMSKLIWFFGAIGLLSAQSVNGPGAFQQATFDPTLRSNVSAPAAQVALEGSLDQGTATGRIGFFVRDFVFETKLSSPVGKAAKEATLVDLDGLANKATADFGLTWIRWEPTAVVARQAAACEAYYVSEGVAPGDIKKTNDKGEIIYPCTRLALKGSYRDMFDEAVDWGTPVLLTARAKFGREVYEFASSPVFKDERETHTSYAFTGALGTIIPTGDLIQASFQYQKAFEAEDSEQICTAFDGSTSTRCRDIAIGPPILQRKRIIQIEGRIFPSVAVGFNPKIAYDFNKEAVSLQLPIYMFRAKEGGLNGGVIAGWRSDTKSFKVSLFIGQVFTLLGQ